jgi:hypothetical protein
MVLKPRDGLLDEFMLVARDRLHADRVEIVDRRAEPGRVGDVAGPGFEPIRRALIDRLLEGDVGDHDAAALPGRYGLENRLLAVNRADACRREHLMARQQRGVMPPHGAWVLLALASCRAAPSLSVLRSTSSAYPSLSRHVVSTGHSSVAYCEPKLR